MTPGNLASLQACAARHLDDYTAPASDYAFWTYDRRGDPNQLTPVDCLAPELLSVSVRAEAIRELFKPTGPGSKLLVAMQAVLDDPGCRAADFRG